MQEAVQQAIASMRDRYFEPITLKDLASEVFVSPFHFCRVFSRATGVTPGRYLTAVRLFEAKRLLLTTSQTVSDIVCSVGYSSIGTFTTRFTRAVGMTPTQYRDPEVGKLLMATAPHFWRLPSPEVLYGAVASGACHDDGWIAVRIEMPLGCTPGNILVGAFDEPIPQRGPAAFEVMPGTSSTQVKLGVPSGRCTVIAAAEQVGEGVSPASFLFGAARQQVAITRGHTVPVTVQMRSLQPTDPPIAITLASPPTRFLASRAASGVTDVRHLRSAA